MRKCGSLYVPLWAQCIPRVRASLKSLVLEIGCTSLLISEVCVRNVNWL